MLSWAQVPEWALLICGDRTPASPVATVQGGTEMPLSPGARRALSARQSSVPDQPFWEGPGAWPLPC